ncbi:hypothetical protein D6829_00610, partial [Candidatus Pacearchaeota archaeon]
SKSYGISKVLFSIRYGPSSFSGKEQSSGCSISEVKFVDENLVQKYGAVVPVAVKTAGCSEGRRIKVSLFEDDGIWGRDLVTEGTAVVKSDGSALAFLILPEDFAEQFGGFFEGGELELYAEAGVLKKGEGADPLTGYAVSQTSNSILSIPVSSAGPSSARPKINLINPSQIYSNGDVNVELEVSNLYNNFGILINGVLIHPKFVKKIDYKTILLYIPPINIPSGKYSIRVVTLSGVSNAVDLNVIKFSGAYRLNCLDFVDFSSYAGGTATIAAIVTNRKNQSFVYANVGPFPIKTNAKPSSNPRDPTGKKNELIIVFPLKEVPASSKVPIIVKAGSPISFTLGPFNPSSVSLSIGTYKGNTGGAWTSSMSRCVYY